MAKPKWACSECGMWSSRKYSVFRHISLVHGGNGFLVPFMDYLVGRIWGVYPSGTSSLSPVSQRKGKDFDPFATSYEEFWKEMGRETARKFHSRR